MKRIMVLVTVCVLGMATPVAAEQWTKPSDYTPVLTTHRPLIVILDMTTKRPATALSDGRTLAQALINHMPEGKPLVIYRDYGERVELVTSREGVIKPTPCKKRHPLFDWGAAPCSQKGYEAAKAAFFETVESAFAPYFKVSDANQSRPFTATAQAATDHSLGRNVGGDIFYLTDGLPYSELARFSSTASWLEDGEGKTALQERLALRGLLPDLRGYRLHMVGVGRTLNGRSTLSADTASKIIQFWGWYASMTGASLSIAPTFSTPSIQLMQTLETVE